MSFCRMLWRQKVNKDATKNFFSKQRNQGTASRGLSYYYFYFGNLNLGIISQRILHARRYHPSLIFVQIVEYHRCIPQTLL
jgi:hypothetical protein